MPYDASKTAIVITAQLADYERVRRVALLAEEFSIEKITPTLMVKRAVIDQKYDWLIDDLYPS